MLEILPETPDRHADAIEALFDRTFGPGHFSKTAERLREGNISLPAINRVTLKDEKVIGVCRVWPIEIGTQRQAALFFGPVAIDPMFRGKRLGLSVTGEAIEAATKGGWQTAVIIGAPDYFGELGFNQVKAGRLNFPGPQDQRRVMLRALAGSVDALEGAVRVPRDPSIYA
ncbi:MAG: N-acetyltransferase [Henriciella sp.]